MCYVYSSKLLNTNVGKSHILSPVPARANNFNEFSQTGMGIALFDGGQSVLNELIDEAGAKVKRNEKIKTGDGGQRHGGGAHD